MKALSRILLAGLVAAALAPTARSLAEDSATRDTEDAQETQPAPASAARDRERLDLDTTVVTGNRELPKVLYIVPWKKAEVGEIPGQPFNTLLDEVLNPLDRDEFRRQVRYFEATSVPRAAGPVAP